MSSVFYIDSKAGWRKYEVHVYCTHFYDLKNQWVKSEGTLKTVCNSFLTKYSFAMTSIDRWLLAPFHKWEFTSWSSTKTQLELRKTEEPGDALMCGTNFYLAPLDILLNWEKIEIQLVKVRKMRKTKKSKKTILSLSQSLFWVGVCL